MAGADAVTGAAPRVLAVIPARGGSKSIPRKNVQLLAGRPLIAYSIEAARRCPLVSRTVVSTDDAEIQDAALREGAEAPFLRPAQIATDAATTEAVLTHAVEWYDREADWRADIVVFLQPTDVFRRQAWLAWVVQALVDDPALESAFMVYPTHKNYWTSDNGTPRPLGFHGYGPRQAKPPVYREDTGLACASRADIVRSGRRIGTRVKLFEAEGAGVSVDIHDPFDLWMAEQIIARGVQRPNE